MCQETIPQLPLPGLSIQGGMHDRFPRNVAAAIDTHQTTSEVASVLIVEIYRVCQCSVTNEW